MVSAIDLKYFLELAKTLHLTRSSERLAVSQPTLSHSLKRLETEIGCTLFIRTKKGLRLTASGEKLKASGEELLRRWENVKTEALDEIHSEQGLIRLGVHTALAQYLLPDFMPDFLQKYPRIQLQLVHGLSRHMTEQVVSGNLDVAFAVNPGEHPDLILREILQDEVGIWKTKNCKNNDVLFADTNLIQSQEIIVRLQKRSKGYARIIESSSLEVIANLTASGAGHGIVPARVLESFENGKLERVKETPLHYDRICLVFKNEFRKLKRGEAFLNSIKESFKK